MKFQLHEDIRTLREFYPEPSLRHKVHYAFVHRFLPQYVQQNPYAFFSYLFRRDLPGGAMEPTRFIQSRWAMFEQMAGLVPCEPNPFKDGTVFRRVSDLTMSTLALAGRAAALVQMPTPEQSVEAYFVAVILLASPDHPENWPRDVQARVFTLEATVSDSPEENEFGMVCEWAKSGTHLNFGVLVSFERDAFLQVAMGMLESPAPPAAATYTP